MIAGLTEIYMTPAIHTNAVSSYTLCHITYIFDFLHGECVVNIRSSFHVSRFCDDRLGLKFVCHDYIQTELFYIL